MTLRTSWTHTQAIPVFGKFTALERMFWITRVKTVRTVLIAVTSQVIQCIVSSDALNHLFIVAMQMDY